MTSACRTEAGAAILPFAARPQPAGPDQPRALVNPARWALLEGLVARHLAKGLGANPYAAASPGARCWLHGWHGAVLTRKPVSRETKAPGPGRGRSRAGDRGVWNAADLALLRFCSLAPEPLSAEEIGQLVGRSARAVITRRARLKKDGGA